jgi:hypothetical protein
LGNGRDAALRRIGALIPGATVGARQCSNGAIFPAHLKMNSISSRIGVIEVDAPQLIQKGEHQIVSIGVIRRIGVHKRAWIAKCLDHAASKKQEQIVPSVTEGSRASGRYGG